MALETLVLPKSVYSVLRRLTGETRPDVALSMALKDLVRLRLEAVEAKQASLEKKYGQTFAAFAEAWQRGAIPETHSYTVEKDYWEWEAAITDGQVLRELAESLA
jgi:translation initiation factor 2 alpha subunit (eIF-2alpha)